MALSFVVGYDLILLVLYILTKIFPRISDGQSYTPGWKKIRTRTGCFLCLCSFAAAICGAVYLRWVDVWMVELCPKMTIPEDCTQASKTWANVCWWLIVPTFIAASMVCTSISRARNTLIHRPERLYFLTDHVMSMILFQVSFFLSLPFAYPGVYFTNVTSHTWVVASQVLAIFMIAAYILGTAFWIEGIVKICIQPRRRLPRSRHTRPEGEFVILTSIPDDRPE